MSTRAALFIQTDEGDWQMIYSHYDGMPSHMLPALKAADPQAILDAKEIRQISQDGTVEGYQKPRVFELAAQPTFPEWASHAYLLTATGWMHAKDQTQLDQLAAA